MCRGRRGVAGGLDLDRRLFGTGQVFGVVQRRVLQRVEAAPDTCPPLRSTLIRASRMPTWSAASCVASSGQASAMVASSGRWSPVPSRRPTWCWFSSRSRCALTGTSSGTSRHRRRCTRATSAPAPQRRPGQRSVRAWHDANGRRAAADARLSSLAVVQVVADGLSVGVDPVGWCPVGSAVEHDRAPAEFSGRCRGGVRRPGRRRRRCVVGVLPVGDVVGIEPGERGVAAGVGAAAVAGEHGPALLFGEQPLLVGVGEDAAGLGQQGEQDPGFGVQPPFGDETGTG